MPPDTNDVDLPTAADVRALQRDRNLSLVVCAICMAGLVMGVVLFGRGYWLGGGALMVAGWGFTTLLGATAYKEHAKLDAMRIRLSAPESHSRVDDNAPAVRPSTLVTVALIGAAGSIIAALISR